MLSSAKGLLVYANMTIVNGPLAGAGSQFDSFSLPGDSRWMPRREVGYCFTADGTDINKAIIAQGRRWPVRVTTPVT